MLALGAGQFGVVGTILCYSATYPLHKKMTIVTVAPSSSYDEKKCQDTLENVFWREKKQNQPWLRTNGLLIKCEDKIFFEISVH